MGSAPHFRKLRFGLSLAVLTLLGGCSVFGDDSNTAPPPPPYLPVEFAMPPGSSIDHGDTIVVGDSMNWYGTLALTSDSDVDTAHQFYATELPREGWEPLAALQAGRVVLQFVNRHQNRAAIVTIEDRTALSGSHIQIIVSPLIGTHAGDTSDRPPPER